MLDKNQAEAIVKAKIAGEYQSYPGTTVFIKKCYEYDFGWFFKYGTKGAFLAGGPEYGVFVHRDGFTYAPHYVGTSWDTGYVMSQLMDHRGEPTKVTVRYFLKKHQMKDASNPSFETENGFDYETAINWLKVGRCLSHEDAMKVLDPAGLGWQTVMVGEETLQRAWCKVRNDGFKDENWEKYYGR